MERGGLHALLLGGLCTLAACKGEAGASTTATEDSSSAAPPASAAEPAGPPTRCPITVARTGKLLTQPELDRIGGPVSDVILKAGDDCPKSFVEVQAKLAKLDDKDCTPAGGPAPGVKTRIVSERAQVLGAPDRMRAVVSRVCNGRKPWGLLLSVFGITVDAAALPEDAELIGYVPERGVFDFWSVEKGKWTFFGDSMDLIGDGYDCPGGACKAHAAEKTRCAECHTGGGLVMKELNTPWVHWEGDTTVTTPGVEALLAKFPAQLGTRTEGSDLETNIVVNGNQQWIKKRVELMKAKGTAELLRPLFCSVQINLQSGAAPGTMAGKIKTVPDAMNVVLNDFLLDPAWGKADNIPIKPADYAALVKKLNQHVVDGDKKQLVHKQPVADTFFPFTYPERAAEDVEYVSRLVSAHVVDDDFVKDVLAIDFTRPLFSAERCGLLAYAPPLDAAGIKADAIREGFVAKLKAAAPAAGTPAAQLLANLESKGDGAAHAAEVDKFLAACKARPQKELVEDVLDIAAMLRSKARTLKIMEFNETMVFDDVKPSEKWLLDPATCKKTER